MNSDIQATRASASETISFVAAGLCAVLALIVAPMTGGATWLILVIGAFLAWQGYRLRRNRITS